MSWWVRVLLVAGCTASAGACGGGGSSQAADEPAVPADDSLESIQRFIDSDGFLRPGWMTIYDAPRAPEGQTTSPHGEVQIYFSPALIAARQANPDPLVSPAVPGAMAVKALHDGAEVGGWAVMYYASDTWMYYCYGPGNRCSGTEPAPAEAPLYGPSVSSCRFCHGGNINTELP